MSWIKTSERMPELTHKLYDYCGYEFWMSDPVILVYEGKTAIGAYAGEDGWCLLNGDQRYTSGEVTHWMPLPEPPTDGEAIEEEPTEMSDVRAVVRGAWEWLSSTYDREPCHMRYRCSNCHQEVMTHGQEPWEHFCPNCGADMRRK